MKLLFTYLKPNIESNTQNIRTELPPRYLDFIKQFDIKEVNINMPSFLSPTTQQRIILGEFSYFMQEVNTFYGFYDFFSLTKALELFEEEYKENDDPQYKNLLPIGHCAGNIIIFLGVGKHNQDEIFFEGFFSFTNDRVIKVADDIYKFIFSLKFVVSEELFIRPYKFSQLYQNWGEDFWRVREE